MVILKESDLLSRQQQSSSITVPLMGRDDILLPLSQHGLSTLQSLGRLAQGSMLRASLVCHETPDSQREVRGWVLDTPATAPASSLPIPYNLFHGVTVVLCETTESDVLSLMQNIDDTRAKLADAINVSMKPIQDEINNSTSSVRASWARCRPSPHQGHPKSLQTATKDKDGNVIFQQDDRNTPIIDSESWLPELSPGGFIGFFHHWHHGTRDSKLCLYAVCQSYLPKACMEFADMVHEAGDLCTSGCICLSEEAQWLRTACARNRARLIADVCSHMGIKVPTIIDYNGAAAIGSSSRTALPTTDTLHHDLVFNSSRDSSNNNFVRLLNYCSETKSAFNGSICTMAPWEGIWIFQGLSSAHGTIMQGASIADFGQAYGRYILPTASPKIHDRTSFTNSPLAFISADPLQCKPLQIWNTSSGNIVVTADASLLSDDHSIKTNNSTEAPHACSSIPLDGLDPDVIAAFQRSIALRACPASFLVPNIPGALPPSMASNYLVFDEQVLAAMSKLGWSRTQGVIKLAPMACALYEHWKTQGTACYDTV